MSDTTAPVVAGDHCKQITPHLAVCSTAGSDGMFDGEGDDRLTGGPGRDGLHGGPGTDTVNGGAGDDFLYADAGGDTVDGDDGNDFLDGGLRGDDLTGGDGGDTVSHASRGSGAPVAVTLGPGQPAANDGADPNRDGTSAGSEEGDDVEEVEHVTGGAGPDILVGSAVANSLRGGLGNDRLDGGLGADLLDARRDRFVRVAPALNAC